MHERQVDDAEDICFLSNCCWKHKWKLYLVCY